MFSIKEIMYNLHYLFGWEGLSIGGWGITFFVLVIIHFLIPKPEDWNKRKFFRNLRRNYKTKFEDGEEE